MIAIPFQSDNPAVQALIASYNECASVADEDGLQITLDMAEELRRNMQDEGEKKKLFAIKTACQAALAELNGATVLIYPADPVVDEFVQQIVATIQSME
jgi:hypothetical protein